jgi:hypothetical protein
MADFKRFILTLMVSAGALAVPWLVTLVLVMRNWMNADPVIVFLAQGGNRGRMISGVLFSVPVIAAGFVVGRLGFRLGKISLAALVAVNWMVSIVSVYWMYRVTAQWPVKLYDAGLKMPGRAVEALLYVLIGGFFGYVSAYGKHADAGLKN